MQLAQSQSFLHCHAWAFAPNPNELIWQFQLTVNSSASMATWSNDLHDQMSGATVQTEGHTLTPPNGQICPEEMEASGSALSHSPSQSPGRRQTPDCPETQYCLEIQVTSTKDGWATPPPPHVWQVPVVEDMLQDSKSGIREVVWQTQVRPSYSMEDNP